MHTTYRDCYNCHGSGRKAYMSPTDTSPICVHCNGSGRVVDYNAPKPKEKPSEPKEPVPLYIWFFGAMGALFGGASQPWGLAWYIEAFFGFIIAGFLAGVLNQFRIGRIILIVIGVAFVLFIAAGIWWSSTNGGNSAG